MLLFIIYFNYIIYIYLINYIIIYYLFVIYIVYLLFILIHLFISTLYNFIHLFNDDSLLFFFEFHSGLNQPLMSHYFDNFVSKI